MNRIIQCDLIEFHRVRASEFQVNLLDRYLELGTMVVSHESRPAARRVRKLQASVSHSPALTPNNLSLQREVHFRHS